MTNAASFLLPEMFLAQGANTDALVTWSDFRAILPVLVLLATGTLVLLIDCFNRGLSRPEAAGKRRSSLSAVINLLGLLGAVMAGALAVSSMQQPEMTAFQDSIRVDSFSSSVSLLIILGTFFSLLGAIDYLKRFDAELILGDRGYRFIHLLFLPSCPSSLLVTCRAQCFTLRSSGQYLGRLWTTNQDPLRMPLHAAGRPSSACPAGS